MNDDDREVLTEGLRYLSEGLGYIESGGGEPGMPEDFRHGLVLLKEARTLLRAFIASTPSADHANAPT